MKKQKLYDSFVNQLKSTNENTLQNDSNQKLKSKLLLKLVSDNGSIESMPLSMHKSHNSHGDWNKHWAQGAFSTPIKARKE
jgi:hypothetical protein